MILAIALTTDRAVERRQIANVGDYLSSSEKRMMCSMLRSSGRPHPQPASQPSPARSAVSCGCSALAWLSSASPHRPNPFSAAASRKDSLCSPASHPVSRLCRPCRSICSSFRSVCGCPSLLASWPDFLVHLDDLIGSKAVNKLASKTPIAQTMDTYHQPHQRTISWPACPVRSWRRRRRRRS